MKPPPATTEDLLAAYEKAGKEEQKLVRDLVRAGKGEEARLITEILHFFPGAHLTKRDTLDRSPPGPTPE